MNASAITHFLKKIGNGSMKWGMGVLGVGGFIIGAGAGLFTYHYLKKNKLMTSDKSKNTKWLDISIAVVCVIFTIYAAYDTFVN